MSSNTLYTLDNLFLLNGMDSESVDLIYLDPPFNSKRTYSAPVGSKSAGASFKDMWRWDDVNIAYLERLYETHPDIADFIDSIYRLHSTAMASYIAYMTQRLLEMNRILKVTGSIYVHIDPTASHYLKIIMDGIFGKNNFRNEIIWCYSGPSGSRNNFPKKHDTILRYSKSDDWVFNDDDVRIPYKRLNSDKGKKPAIWGDGGGKLQDKDVQAEYIARGRLPADYWTDIPAGGHISPKERTGYPTQKPLALLHRIIKASSNKGDVVFDPFCGCATACVASQQLNRKWIGCDIEEKAADILVERLSGDAGMFSDFINTTIPPQRTDVERIAPAEPIKTRLHKAQTGKCNGCFNEFEQRNLEIDHVIPKSKGGGDYYENYQLLCGNCNRVKGNRPMEYLLAKVKKIKEAREVINYS